MPTIDLTHCNICDYPFDSGEAVIAVTGGYMDMGRNGPVEDDKPWLSVFCFDCWEHMHTDIEVCQQNVKHSILN